MREKIGEAASFSDVLQREAGKLFCLPCTHLLQQEAPLHLCWVRGDGCMFFICTYRHTPQRNET
jgi:hypothetical protein